MKNALYLIPILFAFIFPSCDIRTSEYKGESIEKEIDIKEFSSIDVEGAFEVVLIQGDKEGLIFQGNEDLINKIEVDQNDDQLSIFLNSDKNKSLQKNELKIFITLTTLDRLSFKGVGEIKNDGFLVLDKLEINGQGVGNIELNLDANEIITLLNFVGNMKLTGSTEQLYLSNEGIGNIDAAELIAQNVEIISQGIGAVSVHCENELSLEVSGIGSVSYTGNPEVISEKVSGLGKINRN